MTPQSLPLRRAAGAGLLGALLMLAGCASPAVEQYAAEQPRLLLREYFDGPMTAHGVFTDRSGQVVRRFTVKLVGRWNGPEGVLEEDFFYSDGKTERRVWRLTDHGGGRYTGRADDVVTSSAGRPPATRARPMASAVSGSSRISTGMTGASVMTASTA